MFCDGESLARIKGEGFFAEDVLAGVCGCQHPGFVQLVWKRNIDGVDIRVGQQCLVRAIRLRNSELSSPRD